MAMTGVLRPGFIQLRVLDMPAAVEHYTKRIGLHQVAEGADGRVYLKSADEFDHHSIVLRRADQAGFDVMAFKVADDSDLDSLREARQGLRLCRRSCRRRRAAGRRPPHRLHASPRAIASNLFAHADLSDPKPPIHNPDVWDLEPHGMGARRFDHALLYGPDIEKVLDFFTKVLDFNCAERVDMPDGLLAIWLTCGMKAHDIAFVKHPEPGKLHHVAFDLENWSRSAMRPISSPATTSRSTSARPATASRAARRSISSIPRAIATKCSRAATPIIPIIPTRTWDETQIGKGIFYYERQLNDAFLSVVT